MVWRWLVQMGVDRAGWYSWDRLDNFGRRSAERVHPEWQAIAVGDRFIATPSGSTWWEVAACEPERFLGLRMSLDLRGRPFDPAGPRPRFFTDSTWCWLLAELPGGRTRVVESGYWCMRPRWLQPIVGFLFIEAQHWVMQTRQFANLKRRIAREQPSPDPTVAATRPLASSASHPTAARPDVPKLSDQLERWLTGESARTMGSLVETFGTKSFAVLFMLLLAVPALPLPTGGVTHVFEIIAALVAVQLVAGRHQIWLPRRWRGLELGGSRQQRFITSLMKLIRRLERISRPRLSVLFHHRASDIVFGMLVLGGSAAAFVAPPFSGLDTLPSLGVVLLSLGTLLEDFLVVVVAVALGVAGVVLEIVIGSAAIHGLGSLF